MYGMHFFKESTMRHRLIMLVLLCSAILFVSCGDSGGGGSSDIYEIDVGVMVVSGTPWIFAEVLKSGSPVSDCTVEVNTTDIPYDGGSGEYRKMGAPPTIIAGDTVNLIITRGGKTLVNKTLTMPDAPVITAPTAGTYNANQVMDVTWNSLAGANEPEFIMIQVEETDTASGSEYSGMEIGTATSHTIPANTFDAPKSNIQIMVFAGNRTTSLGEYAKSGSEFGVAYVTMSDLFDTI